jgi:dTDP-4-amino-4,6-dideoxygalactose transaminase
MQRRIENQQVYERRFRGSTNYHVPSNSRGVTCSISFVALANSLEHRDRVGQALVANGVETRPLGGGSMGRQPYWSDRYGACSYPVADAIHERSFMLPNNPLLTVHDIETICDIVLAVPATLAKAA